MVVYDLDSATGFITIKEAAKIAGIAPGSMSRLCHESGIVFCKRPLKGDGMPQVKGWVVSRSSVRDYLKHRGGPRQHGQPWARHVDEPHPTPAGGA